MSAKQYLKMADVFRNEMRVVGDSNNMIADDVGIIIGCYSGDMMAEYVLHAINSHDELVAENERLRDEIAVALGEKQSTVIIPEGWQLVPVEPTLEMISAATSDSVGFGTRAEYKAMLAAAPKYEGGAS